LTKETPQERAEWIEALLALALDQEPAPGPRPTLEDVAAWHAGQLSGVRAEEVKAHVARDPECYGWWMELRAAEAQLETSGGPTVKGEPEVRPVPWWRRWLQASGERRSLAVGGLGVAVAAVLVVAVGVRMRLAPGLYEGIDRGYEAWEGAGVSPPEEWRWQTGLTRGSPPGPDSAPDSEGGVQAFRAGMRAGLEGLLPAGGVRSLISGGLPDDSPECPAGSAGTPCERQNQLMHATGRWGALIYLSCGAPSPPPGPEPPDPAAFWTSQRRVLDQFARSEALPETYRSLFMAWSEAPGAPREVLCVRVGALLDLGLTDVR